VIRAHAESTSCVRGGRLGFVLAGPAGAPPRGRVLIEDTVDRRVLLEREFHGPYWELEVPSHWPSSLCRAVFLPTPPAPPLPVPSPPVPEPAAPGPEADNEVHFVVRPAPGTLRAPVLLSIPFATWQAYNRSGVPGEGLYWTEDPQRAARVSFDRPGVDVDYCSNLDLHLDPTALSGHRLLIVSGHDEYWTWEMRDAVEGFTARGGNTAFFAANTAWWQMRLEDGGRTMVCHRDAAADPLAATRPERTTVEWSSAPVNRPETAMTGLSFRYGAGCWGPEMPRMREAAYTVRFADHWVFAGTGLRDGDGFGRGALGYETDAAHLEEVDGVPRATGRGGTPESFCVLATADLRHWAAYGQGGAATLGVFSSGAGTVFNAGTVNWGAALDDPVVDRITRNVVERLSAPPGAAAAAWTGLGTSGAVRALTVHAQRIVAVLDDGTLAGRDTGPQNLPWQPVRQRSGQPAGSTDGITALATPREAVTGGPLGVYAARADGRLLWSAAPEDPDGWTVIGRCPAGTTALAACDGRLHALDRAGLHWCAPQGSTDDGPRIWTRAAVPAPPAGLTALTSLNGRLYAVSSTGELLSRLPDDTSPWTAPSPAEAADGCTVLAGHAGLLLGAGGGGPLRQRAVPAPHLPRPESGPAPGPVRIPAQLSRTPRHAGS
jgi:hypothetical protein